MVDLRPRMYPAGKISKVLLKAREEAIAKFKKRPCSNHNVYEYLLGRPKSTTIEDLAKHENRATKMSKL